MVARTGRPASLLHLIPCAEVPDTEMVSQEDRAGNAETPDLFLVRAGGYTPCTEEPVRLEVLVVMGLVVRAVPAVRAADCTVLFRIFDNDSSTRYHT